MKHFALIPGALAALLATGAQAHFQLLYTPEVMLDRPGEIDLALVFGHPMENAHTMSMGQPEELFVVFKGEKTDLLDTLEPVRWQGSGSTTADAFKARYKVRRNGDYIFALVPAPYLEASEDIYIQQITKSVVNKGSIPTGWNEPLGLPTEIVPLNKPYQVFAGGTFSGQLLSEGKPAPGVECEIEYINTEVDIAAAKFAEGTMGTVPPTAIVAITDPDGRFTFGIPRPGVWGFACLGSGPIKEYKGKELSQDAVIWVNASSLASQMGPAAAADVAFSATRDAIMAAQRALRSRGFDPGPIDGLMGPRTKRAIEAFQREESLPVTGSLSAELAARLGL
jgi:cobalt/nickel transport protein